MIGLRQMLWGVGRGALGQRKIVEEVEEVEKVEKDIYYSGTTPLWWGSRVKLRAARSATVVKKELLLTTLAPLTQEGESHGPASRKLKSFTVFFSPSPTLPLPPSVFPACLLTQSVRQGSSSHHLLTASKKNRPRREISEPPGTQVRATYPLSREIQARNHAAKCA